MCVRCKEDFYLSDNGTKCLPWTNLSKNCERKNDADRCEICQENTYYSNGYCLPNPEGIFGCVEYSSRSTCKVC